MSLRPGRRVVSRLAQFDGYDAFMDVPEADRNRIRVTLDGRLVPYDEWISADEFGRFVQILNPKGHSPINRIERGTVRIEFPSQPSRIRS